MMGNFRSFISKAKAVAVATALVFTGIGATTAPTVVTAATLSSGASKGAMEFAAHDFGGYLGKVNDSFIESNPTNAKEAFEICEPDADVSGEGWKFGVTVGSYYLDFMGGMVTTGGYATGATVDVFRENESLFTASREGDRINYGFNNSLDLTSVTSSGDARPFILTGSVSWGVETVCSADVAFACALYEYCVAEVEEEERMSQQPNDECISALYDFFHDGNMSDNFEKLRVESCNGISNGWKSFADAKDLIAGSNGNNRWKAGVWEIYVSGQELTNAGLSQGYITATDPATGNLLRFSFTEDGTILVQKKVDGVYAASYHNACGIEEPQRYGVIDMDGKKIDSELIALAATVNKYCIAAPRG